MIRHIFPPPTKLTFLFFFEVYHVQALLPKDEYKYLVKREFGMALSMLASYLTTVKHGNPPAPPKLG